MTPDAGIFQHIGWYVARGARLYVDAWEPKPPLSYETTGLLAVLAGGDIYLLHLLSVLTMMAMACGIVGLVAALAWNVTGDPFAASIAGGSMLLLPGYLVRPAYGYKAKYPLLLFGLLAIYLAIRSYPALAGAAAAASVGYWQAAIVFPVLVIGIVARRGDRRSLVRMLAGGAAFTGLMLLPVFVLWHSETEMVVQAVLVPLTTHESTPLLERIVAGVAHFKWASPLVLLGGVGLYRTAVGAVFDRNDPTGRGEWWIAAGAGWFAFLVLFVDFETGGYTDLIPGLAFVALGLGVVAARLTRHRPRQILASAVACVLVVNVAFLGGFGFVFPPVDTPDPVPMSDLETNDRGAAVSDVGSVPDVRYIYWHRIEPDTCHYRLSLMEVQWLQQTHHSTQCMGFDAASGALSGR